jgi:hypothetical protein
MHVRAIFSLFKYNAQKKFHQNGIKSCKSEQNGNEEDLKNNSLTREKLASL